LPAGEKGNTLIENDLGERGFIWREEFKK